MLVSELITVCREDYLDDNVTPYLWPDTFFIRAFAESERQACNRTKFLYNDSTASIVEITLVEDQATYSLSQKITYIETILWETNLVSHKSKEELDRETPDWRTDTGLTDVTITAFVRGRSIRFSRIPDATDAGSKVYLEVYTLPLTELTLVTETPSIPDENHRDLCWNVLQQAYSKNDEDSQDLSKANYYEAKVTEAFGDYVSAEVRLNQFNSPKVLTLRPVNYYGSRTRGVDESLW